MGGLNFILNLYIFAEGFGKLRKGLGNDQSVSLLKQTPTTSGWPPILAVLSFPTGIRRQNLFLLQTVEKMIFKQRKGLGNKAVSRVESAGRIYFCRGETGVSRFLIRRNSCFCFCMLVKGLNEMSLWRKVYSPRK